MGEVSYLQYIAYSQVRICEMTKISTMNVKKNNQISAKEPSPRQHFYCLGLFSALRVGLIKIKPFETIRMPAQ